MAFFVTMGKKMKKLSDEKIVAIVGERRKSLIMKWRNEMAKELDRNVTIGEVINWLIDKESSKRGEERPKVFY